MLEEWQMYVATTVSQLGPKALSILMILLAGSSTAYILGKVTEKLVNRLDFAFNYISLSNQKKRKVVQSSYANILSKVVIVAIMLLTFQLCANIIGWNLLTNWIHNVTHYFPNVVSCLLIILTGFLLANITKSIVKKTAASIGIAQVDLLAQTSFFITVILFALIGIEQLGINITFITVFLVVSFGILLSGLTVAFSLGAKTTVENLLGAQYVKTHCRCGENISIDGVTGQIVDIKKTYIVLDTQNGRSIIPAKLFSELKSHINLSESEKNES